MHEQSKTSAGRNLVTVSLIESREELWLTYTWIKSAWKPHKDEWSPAAGPAWPIMVPTLLQMFPNAAAKTNRLIGLYLKRLLDTNVIMMKRAPNNEKDDATRSTIEIVSSCSCVNNILLSSALIMLTISVLSEYCTIVNLELEIWCKVDFAFQNSRDGEFV